MANALSRPLGPRILAGNTSFINLSRPLSLDLWTFLLNLIYISLHFYYFLKIFPTSLGRVVVITGYNKTFLKPPRDTERARREGKGKQKTRRDEGRARESAESSARPQGWTRGQGKDGWVKEPKWRARRALCGEMT
jgi:hypothetical protein